MKVPKKKAPSANHKSSTPFFNKSGEQSFFAQNSSNAFFKVQPKLTIGKPNDQYEKEADTMADQVVNTSSPKTKVADLSNTQTSIPDGQPINRMENISEEEVQTKPLFSSITPIIQRMGDLESDRTQASSEEENVQAKSNTASNQETSSNFESKLKSSPSSGNPLPKNTKSEMESNFGADFSGVRIHNNSNAANLSTDINAQAFTHGKDIYFNSGKYKPEQKEGKHLLAHELTHTVQQGAAPQISPKLEFNAASTIQRKASSEEETDFAAELRASEQDQQNAIDPSIANQARQEANQSLNIQAPTDNYQPPAAPPIPAQSNPTAAPPTPPPAKEEEIIPEDQVEEIGSVGKVLEAQSANVCDDAGKKATKLAQNEKTHDQADDKQKQTESAVVTPAAENQASSNTDQVGDLDQTSTPSTNEIQAKQKLDQELNKAVPKSIKEMNEFKSKGKAKVVGNEVLGEVNKDVSNVQNTYNAIEQAPPPKPIEPSAALPNIEVAPGTKKLNLGKEAVPALAPEHTDFTAFDNQSDDLLQKEEISQEQLDMVDTGDLAEANKERKGLKQKVAQEPTKIQEFAQIETKQVETDLQKEEGQQKQAMKKKREQELNKTKEKQGKTKTDLEKKREAVAIKINGIYTRAQTSVKTKLENLEKDSLNRFDTQQAIASNEFENEVKTKVGRWKSKRYSGILAGAKWLKDKLLGIDDFPEVKRIFADAKTNFVNKIDLLIAAITRDNNQVIADCKQEIQDAKIEIKEFVDSLGPELKNIGQKSMEEMEGKLKELDGFIDKKKEELQQKLCDKKEEAIKNIDKKIEAMKEEMSGALSKLGNLLLDAAMKFFKWALEKAGKSPDKIMGIINKGKSVLKKIFTDPIGFIMNVVTGVKQGINNFSANIKQHLVGGMISWLTGAMGDLPIQLPTTWNLKGIISLVLQVLGVSWDIIRNKLVKRVGEKVVAAAETSVDIIKKLITEGPIAIWEMIKEKAVEIKTAVMDGIQNWVAVELVKQGIIKLVSFLNPAGAIVQAIIAIYNTVMFFVENWDRIVDFVQSIFNSIGDLAMGKLGAAAKTIERAMGLTIPIMLGFLSRLIGISGIGKAVKKIITKIRRPIDKVVDKAIKFMVKKVKKLFGKGGKKKGKDDSKKATDKDHPKIAQQAINELKKDKPKETDYRSVRNKKEIKAKKIEEKYSAKLKKGIKLKIIFESEAKDKKDDDLDFKVIIAPNTTTRMSSLEIKARLSEKEVVDKVKEAKPIAESQFPSSKLPTWAAVFATAGKKINVEKPGPKKGTAITMEIALGGNMNNFKSKIQDALRASASRISKKFLTQNGITQDQIDNRIEEVANNVVNNIRDKELTFITPTDIPRNIKLKNQNFVIINSNLRSLDTSKSSSLYKGTVKKATDHLNNLFKAGLKKAKIKQEIHHATGLYLGGGHEMDNLLTLFGNAGVPTEPHGFMHEIINDSDISNFLETDKPITLANDDLRKHFDDEKLKVLIGTMKTTGDINYKQTDLNIKK